MGPEEEQAEIQSSQELFAQLGEGEKAWRDRQPFLQSRGYMLRPRYRPGWVPSWKGTNRHPIDFEDHIRLPIRRHLIDATRIEGGQIVYIKRVKTNDAESTIATLLRAPPLRDNPANHCVPILDLFEDDVDSSISYMVMPFLRLIDSPEFETVDNLIDCADQLLEGLVFLHDHGVAHRDCTYRNILMEATALFPKSFHPVYDELLPDGYTPAPILSRICVPVKYYYVDFGISVFIPPDVHPKLAIGPHGRDKEVPELSETVPYDPFKVDIFILGNFFRRYFYDKFSNVDFFLPLIRSMTQEVPTSRPTAAEALAQWKTIRCRVSAVHRAWKPRAREDPWFARVGYDVYALFRTVYYGGRYIVERSSELQG